MTDLERYLSIHLDKTAAFNANAFLQVIRGIVQEQGMDAAVDAIKAFRANPENAAKIIKQFNLSGLGITAEELTKGNRSKLVGQALGSLKALGGQPATGGAKGFMQNLMGKAPEQIDDAAAAYQKFMAGQRGAAKQLNAPATQLREGINTWMQQAQAQGKGRKFITQNIDDFLAGKADLPAFTDRMGVPLHRGVTSKQITGIPVAEKAFGAMQRDPTSVWKGYQAFNPEGYAALEASKGGFLSGWGAGPGILRRTYNATPKWLLGAGAGVGGFGLANLLAQPRVDAARREGFGQATGQMTPLIQGMYGNQGAWRLPPYAQG